MAVSYFWRYSLQIIINIHLWALDRAHAYCELAGRHRVGSEQSKLLVEAESRKPLETATTRQHAIHLLHLTHIPPVAERMLTVGREAIVLRGLSTWESRVLVIAGYRVHKWKWLYSCDRRPPTGVQPRAQKSIAFGVFSLVTLNWVTSTLCT